MMGTAVTEKRDWTPDEVRTVASAIYGPSWQSPLAADIAAATGTPFKQARVSHWYLESGGRPIPAALMPVLTDVLRGAMDRTEAARDVAGRIIEAHSG